MTVTGVVLGLATMPQQFSEFLTDKEF